MENAAVLAWTKRIVITMGVLLLGACSWFSSDEVKPAKLVSFTETTALAKQWSHHLGSQGEPEWFLRLQPVLDSSIIYAANAKGKVYAFQSTDGDTLWSVNIHLPLAGAVGAGEGLVLLGTVDGKLVALQQRNGTEAWRYQLSSEILSPAQVGDGIVVAQTIDGKVVALDVKTGEVRWSYTATVAPLTLRGSATPLIDNGVVYLVFTTGKLVAVKSDTGFLLWEQQIALPEGRSELERIIDSIGQPVLSGEDLYVANYQSHVSSVNHNNGTITWTEKISTAGQLASGNGNLYLTQSDDTVTAMSMASGRHLWENNQLANRQLTSPAMLGAYVAVADAEGYIHLLNQGDGQFAGRYAFDDDGVRTPLVSDGTTLYALSNDGVLASFRLTEATWFRKIINFLF